MKHTHAHTHTLAPGSKQVLDEWEWLDPVAESGDSGEPICDDPDVSVSGQGEDAPTTHK